MTPVDHAPMPPVPPWRLHDARDVRAAIARRWLAAHGDAPGDGARDADARVVATWPDARLGDIDLRPHQLAAVRRVRAALREFGGALLADATGLGKTYVALALAREERDAVVVAPAALRDMWREAMARAGLELRVVTHEALSRGGRLAGASPGLVIVDEAHHARNPRTRRFAALAGLCVGARVLLLSATPVHNRRADLIALLSLFLGGRAGTMDGAELARAVVRRSRVAPGAAAPPEVRPTVTLALPHDESLLDAIVALPPPVPPAGGGDGGALLAWTLVRQWASSDGALAGALRRRLARAAALESALEAGRHPSASELRGWTAGDDAVQLALPELLAETSGTTGLLAAVRVHGAAVRALLARVDPRPTLPDEDVRERMRGADGARARLLRELRRRHPGERIVAFSAHADTVSSLFRRLVALGEPGVAALTADGAQVAGGSLGRAQALRRFAPVAHGAREPAVAERIGLLLATDLLSEGVNLQDASVVVHLDLPWTPARLEQRIGRVARPGSRADAISVYALAPPASAESLLAVEQRLREKAAEAGRSVGVVGAILPSLVPGGHPAPPSAPAATEALAELLRGWARGAAGAAAGMQDDEMAVATLAAGPRGFVALCPGPDGAVELLAADDALVHDDPTRVLEIVRRACAPDADPDGSAPTGTPSAGDGAVRVQVRLADACARLAAWRRAREAEAAAGLRLAPASPVRRAILARVARIARRTPLARRLPMDALLAAGRRAASLPCGAGLERVLEELARSSLADESWLRALAEFARLHEPPAVAHGPDAPRGGPVAILLLGD